MSRGFGFVTFKDEVSVEKCLVMQHTLNGKPVELKRAIRKEDMAAGGSGGGYGGGECMCMCMCMCVCVRACGHIPETTGGAMCGCIA